MPRLSVLLPLLLVAAPCGFAQQAAGTPRVIARGEVCPVWLTAQRDAEGTMLMTQSHQGDPLAQGLKVIFRHAPSPIESVTGTLYATRSFGPGWLLVQSGLPEPDATKPFEFHRAAGQKSLVDFEVWMDNVATLRWVDVTAITYADGTTWKAPKDAVCRAFPSLFVPVNATAR